AATSPAEKARLQALLGKAAIANAKMAYQSFKRIFNEPEFKELRQHGAWVQRCLWASTGTKNPNYSDVLYIEELVGPDTVNTMPPGALAAFRDHGRARPAITRGLDDARRVFADLAQAGVDMPAILSQLQVDALAVFSESFHALMLGV